MKTITNQQIVDLAITPHECVNWVRESFCMKYESQLPTKWKPGMEPYYPVNDDKNSRLYAQYKALADQEKKVHFGGRLAEYKYYDMHVIVEKALAVDISDLDKE